MEIILTIYNNYFEAYSGHAHWLWLPSKLQKPVLKWKAGEISKYFLGMGASGRGVNTKKGQ
jgi:hypothetical protein